MDDRLPVLVLAVALVVALGVGVLWRTLVGGPSETFVVHAGAPHVIGGYGDHFAYNGEGVRRLGGTAELRVDRPRSTGTLHVTVETTEESGSLRLSVDETLTGRISLSTKLDPSSPLTWFEDVFGDSGRGGPDLPQTRAVVTGTGRFRLSVDGREIASALFGEWAVVQATRREDGAIRRSGLLYSPLLRDKTGFVDPERKELILIVRSDHTDPANRPPYGRVLHLVFDDVTLPEDETAAR